MNRVLYGTTSAGGGAGCYYGIGCGSVFSLTTSGKESLLHRFAGGSDGGSPSGRLLYANGMLYGTTNQFPGSSGSDGTIFALTP